MMMVMVMMVMGAFGTGTPAYDGTVGTVKLIERLSQLLRKNAHQRRCRAAG